MVSAKWVMRLIMRLNSILWANSVTFKWNVSNTTTNQTDNRTLVQRHVWLHYSCIDLYLCIFLLLHNEKTHQDKINLLGAVCLICGADMGRGNNSWADCRDKDRINDNGVCLTNWRRRYHCREPPTPPHPGGFITHIYSLKVLEGVINMAVSIGMN